MRSSCLSVWVLVLCVVAIQNQASATIEGDLVQTQEDIAAYTRELVSGGLKMLTTGKYNAAIAKGWAKGGQNLLVKQFNNILKYSNGSNPARAASAQIRTAKDYMGTVRNIPKLRENAMQLFQSGLDYINSFSSTDALSFITSSIATMNPLVTRIADVNNLKTAADSIQTFATSMSTMTTDNVTDMASSLVNNLQISLDSVSGVDIYQTGIIYSNLLNTLDVMQFASDASSYGGSLFAGVATPPQDVCYAGLPCFSMAYPWYSPVRPLPAPQSPTAIGVQFHLYSRANRTRTVIRSDAPYSIRPADYIGTKPTFFIVHGKADDGNSTWAANMKDALLNRVDGNVIVVDWGNGARGLTHMQTASNARVVGAVMTTLGNHLIQQKGATALKMHLIGDGTGGHAAAYMGQAIPNIGRITGLDIDSSWFESYPDVVGLTPDDAVYVDLLHTSGLPTLLGGSGAVLPHGDKDFYINGGALQPGCPNPLILLPTTMTVAYIVNSTSEVYVAYSSCSHVRANQLFTASIVNTCIFVGHSKDSDPTLCSANTCSAMGYDSVLYPATGVFDVATTLITPFCVRDATPDQALIAFQSPRTA